MLCACGETPPEQQEVAPRPVEVAQVTVRDLPVTYEFVGRTASSQRVEIRARVPGFLDEIAYAEGEFVQEGQVLFRIDREPFESKLRAARAEVAQQRARVENAQSLLTRLEPLAESGAVSAKELDDARDRLRESSAALEAARAREFDAELNLGYTAIASPVSGLTSSSSEREGAYISGISRPLTYVARIDPIWVEFSITETQLLRGRRAQSQGAVRPPEDDAYQVSLELADGTRHPFTGRMTFADASVSTQTGAVLVRAEIPNPNQTLRPGQYARVFLDGATRPGAMVVPQRAMQQGPRGPYLWVIDRQGKAEQRPVIAGPWLEDDWVIEDGLRDDDRVVVNGLVGLRPGTPLRIERVIGTPGAAAPEGSGS